MPCPREYSLCDLSNTKRIVCFCYDTIWNWKLDVKSTLTHSTTNCKPGGQIPLIWAHDEGDKVQAKVCTYFVYLPASMYRGLKRGVLQDQNLKLPINIHVFESKY